MSDLVCPFCGQGDFDDIALKWHLIHSCYKYSEVDISKISRNAFFTLVMEERTNIYEAKIKAGA